MRNTPSFGIPLLFRRSMQGTPQRRCIEVLRAGPMATLMLEEAPPPQKRRRHDWIKPTYLFETSVRTWLVTASSYITNLFPAFNQTISLIFM